MFFGILLSFKASIVSALEYWNSKIDRWASIEVCLVDSLSEKARQSIEKLHFYTSNSFGYFSVEFNLFQTGQKVDLTIYFQLWAYS